MEFYRYVAQNYASIGVRVELQTYNLFKETPKGYWIGYGSPDGLCGTWRKWVSKTTKKRFAYPTKEEAMENFVRRTKCRVKILKAQLLNCQIALGQTDKIKEKIS